MSLVLKFCDTGIHSKRYGTIGIAVTLIVGYLFGVVFPSKDKDIDGLTIYTLKKRIPSA